MEQIIRDQFEAWMQHAHPQIPIQRNNVGTYIRPDVMLRWEAYQAAALHLDRTPVVTLLRMNQDALDTIQHYRQKLHRLHLHHQS